MGVPIADQATELTSASRRMTYTQAGRPSDLDIEEKPIMQFPGEKLLAPPAERGAHEADKPSPHYSHRAPWLRALVLGANDGLVSITSLMLGVDAAVGSNLSLPQAAQKATIVSGIAGLIAGACSMAIGEFVSVFSQRDSEVADLKIEQKEHLRNPEGELEELAQIYVNRGLSYYLAKQVAEEFSRVDALKAHARDELGIDLDDLSNPTQAALASAIAFAFGGAVPLLAGAFLSSYNYRVASIVASSSLALLCFGAVGARLGGANMCKAAFRVLAGGWLAMLITYGVLRAIKVIHEHGEHRR